MIVAKASLHHICLVEAKDGDETYRTTRVLIGDVPCELSERDQWLIDRGYRRAGEWFGDGSGWTMFATVVED